MSTKIFAQATVGVSMDLPRFINPGSELIVNMVVDRGVTEGFVKIEEFLPLGITAVAIENDGSEFSFSNNYVTFLWKDIPKVEEFKIKFKLIIPKTIEGKGTIEGKINFLQNGKLVRQSFENFDVTFQKEDADEETTKELETPQKVIVGLPVKSKGSIEKATKEATVTISAKRTFTTLNENEILVQLVIEQNNLTGFLKYEDMIPMGFKVKSENSSGSTFSFIDNKVKFVWSEVPKENKIIPSYKLLRDGNDTKKLTLDGNLQYLDKGETKRIELKDEDINLEIKKNEGVEQITFNPAKNKTPEKQNQEKSPSINANESTTKTNESPKSNTTTKTEKIKKEQPIAKKALNIPTQNSDIPNPAPTKTIVFKVQICATQNKSEAAKVSEEFNVTDAIESEMHDGWYKYTIGRFESYEDAKNFRETKSTIATSPFVAAYYNGRRISVQEAMMIKNQKLMK